MNATQTQEPLLITPDEAARLLGLDQVAKNPCRTVLEMARRGELEARRVSKYTLITRASVDRYVQPAQ